MSLHVPQSLKPGDQWLQDESNYIDLRLLLNAYDVNIYDCYEIAFGVTAMTVYRYKTIDENVRYIENGDVAREDPLTIRYRDGLKPRLQ